MKPWKDFNRTNWPNAFCCIDENGQWFDSGADFATAAYWVYMADSGGTGSPTTAEVLAHMDTTKCSIVSLPMCRTMYEAGLIS